MGRRAAFTSSTRLVRVECGALRTISGFSSIFFRDRNHGIDEKIQFAFALGLGRLNHQRAANDQREADSIRMKAIIDQAFRDVAGADTLLCLPVVAEHAFVHAGSIHTAI